MFEDERGDGEGKGGVDPGSAGEQDGEATDDDRSSRQGVPEHVDEDAADVDIVAHAPEHGRDQAVHEDAGGGDKHHDAGLYRGRLRKAMNRLDGDPTRNEDQRERVEECRENAGTLVAEGFFVGGGTGLEPDGDEGEHDGERVGGVMSGFRDQGEGVGSQAGKQREHHIRNGGDKGEAQHFLHGCSVRAVNMHTGSVYPVWQRGYCTGAEAWGLLRWGIGLGGTDSAVVRRPLQFSAMTMLFSGRWMS